MILGFSLCIPLSKHIHILAAPVGLFSRSLEAGGVLSTPKDLENAESFGATKVQDFTWRELLDGYSCAVCGRCTDNCPASISQKILSPMHIVENLKEHLLDVGPELVHGQDIQEGRPLMGRWIQEEALWDCLTCGACVEACPVGVEHIDTIVDMRRNLVMEQASMPETAMNALMSMEQRGHPWRGTPFTRSERRHSSITPTRLWLMTAVGPPDCPINAFPRGADIPFPPMCGRDSPLRMTSKTVRRSRWRG